MPSDAWITRLGIDMYIHRFIATLGSLQKK